MNLIPQIIIILILFVVLTKAADLVVKSLREIARKLNIKQNFLGIILGFLTTLPEAAIAMNATATGTPALSLGNLYGGIVVLFCLILGLNIVLNKGIQTSGRTTSLTMSFLCIIFPLFLGFRGELTVIDGLLILAWHSYIVYLLYKNSKRGKAEEDTKESETVTFQKSKFFSSLSFMLLGVVAVIISSNFIVRITEDILHQFNVGPFIVGLLLFSLGTNLPEFSIAITAWRKDLRQLSLSNLFGSAFANIMIIGFMALAVDIPITIDRSYYVILIFLIALFLLLMRFYKTGRRLTRKEGYALFALYGIFVAVEIFVKVQ